MKNFFKGIFEKVKKYVLFHKVISGIVIVVILVAGYYWMRGSVSTTSMQYTFGKVTKGNLIVSVAASGQVSTLSKVSIKPNTTGQTQTLGQIVSVEVQNGDYVKAGQVVAVLDGKNALQTLNQAKASVTSAQASYDKLTGGLSDATSLSLNNSVTSAQTSVDNARQNILIQLQSSYTTASNSVYLNTDSFFENLLINPSLSINGVSFLNQGLQNNINQERSTVGQILINWREQASKQTTSDDPIASLNKTLSDLNIIRKYFDDMTTLFAVYSSSQNSSGQSAINSDKGIASSARSSTDSLISSLTSTLQSYNNSLFSLSQAKANLAIQQQPPSADDLAVSQANLDNAKANLANAEVAYASRIITAPFNGQIGGLSASIGQQVSSSDSLGTLITAEKVINVTLNEIDAAKVSSGNIVTISFDSLPGLTLTGKLKYIDPLGTVSSGVVSYAVQISMDTQNIQIKTGMTATVNIVVNQHTNTLLIPTSAITKVTGKNYVLIADMSSSTNPQLVRNFSQSSTTRNFSTSTRRNFASSTFSTSTVENLGRQFGNSTGTGTRANQSISTQYPVKQVEITTGLSNNTTTEVLSGLVEGQVIVTKKSTTIGTTVKSTASSATTNTRMGGGFGGGL